MKPPLLVDRDDIWPSTKERFPRFDVFFSFFFRDFNLCWTHRPYLLVAEVRWQIFTCWKLFVLFWNETLVWINCLSQRIDSRAFFLLNHLSKLHQVRNPADSCVDVPNLLLIEGWTSWSWCQWTANVFKMIRVYLEHLRGAKWMVRGAHSPPLRVILAPLRWCWYIMFLNYHVLSQHLQDFEISLHHLYVSLPHGNLRYPPSKANPPKK